MTAPTKVLWERSPHTEAKHDMLRRYLEAWFPIILQSSRFKAATFLDGFAGPGEYTNAPMAGSPIIALEQVLERPPILGLAKPTNFVFIEHDKRRLAHLSDLVLSRWADPPRQVRIEFGRGRCQDLALQTLTRIEAWRQPIFANLDPFGVDVPAALISRLGRNVSTEVLVTLMSDWFGRFADVAAGAKGDEQFGSDSWRKVATKPTEEKERFLVEEYRSTLRRSGFKFSLAFQLLDDGGHAFFLVYGTTHLRGLEKMKDAMWKVDPIAGLRFRDPRDPQQTALDFGPDKPHLEPLISRLETLLRRRPMTLLQVREAVLLTTVYRKPHATAAIREMVRRTVVAPIAGRLSDQTTIRLSG